MQAISTPVTTPKSSYNTTPANVCRQGNARTDVLTNLELVALLRARLKPYIGVMNKNTHFSTIRRISEGTAGNKAIKRLARAYGFTGSLDAWNVPANTL